MNRFRLIAGWGVCAVSLLAVACGDDDTEAQPAGSGATAGASGQAGKAGAAGKAGVAGNAGAAGKGGSSGAGGAAGNAGTTSTGGGGQTGGTAGAMATGGGGQAGTTSQGGSAGKAGQGGTAAAGNGGAAQAGQGGAGQAGKAGNAGNAQGGGSQAGQGGTGQGGNGQAGQGGKAGNAQGGQGGAPGGQGGAAGKAGGGQGGAGGAFLSSSRHTARAINTLYPGNGFWEYLPPSYSDDGAESALIVFWHGLGENGDGSVASLQKVTSNGPPRFIKENKWPADRPFVVLSPQNADGCPSPNAIKDFTAWAIGHYNVDPKRLYLTGLSCGGIGISNYLAGNVDTTPYAAVVGVSGSFTNAWNTQKCDLGKVAVWGIHGEKDANGGTPPAGTKDPLTSLIACPQPPRRDARLTMIPNGTHSDNSWDTTYGGTLAGVDIYAWFLANAKP